MLIKKRPYTKFRLNRDVGSNKNDVINFFTIYENGVQCGRFYSILFTYLYMAPLAVKTNQKRPPVR